MKQKKYGHLKLWWAWPTYAIFERKKMLKIPASKIHKFCLKKQSCVQFTLTVGVRFKQFSSFPLPT